MSDFVEIHRSSSPIDSRMLKDILEQEGIPVRMTGMENPSNIGGMMIHQYRLKVPAGKVEEAKALVDAFLAEIETTDSEDLPWELREEGDGADQASGVESPDEADTPDS